MSPTPQLIWSAPSTTPTPTPHGATIKPPTCLPASLCPIQRRFLSSPFPTRSMTSFWAAPNDPHIAAKEFGFCVLMLVVAVLAMWLCCACVAAGRRRREWRVVVVGGGGAGNEDEDARGDGEK